MIRSIRCDSTRDGWTVKVHREGLGEQKSRSRIWREYSEPQVWSKKRGSLTLEMRILGVHETEGPWYVMEHRVLDSSANVRSNHEHWRQR